MSVVQKFSNNDEPAQRWIPVTRIGPLHDPKTDSDAVAIEEPLEIRLGLREPAGLRHQAVSVTMRTPGDDFELAAGFLFTEGILRSPEQIATIEHCGPESSPTNIIRVDLKSGIAVEFKRLERNFYTTSSCGVMRQGLTRSSATGATRVASPDSFKVPLEIIHELPAKLRDAQQTFASTGGLHAAGLFTPAGELLGLREDVGRHNAVDKLNRARFLAHALPASDAILFPERPCQLRTGAESRHGRNTDDLCRRGALQSRNRSRPGIQRDVARFCT
jgi:FdhD protein